MLRSEDGAEEGGDVGLIPVPCRVLCQWHAPGVHRTEDRVGPAEERRAEQSQARGRASFAPAPT